jgi:hypothetical protein
MDRRVILFSARIEFRLITKFELQRLRQSPAHGNIARQPESSRFAPNPDLGDVAGGRIERGFGFLDRKRAAGVARMSERHPKREDILIKPRPLTAAQNAKPTRRRSEATYSFGRVRSRLPSNANKGGEPGFTTVSTDARHFGRDMTLLIRLTCTR